MIAQWVQQESERVFIIGGAVRRYHPFYIQPKNGFVTESANVHIDILEGLFLFILICYCHLLLHDRCLSIPVLNG